MADKLTKGTLIPAYGRDYKSADEAVRDFEAGKDFKYVSFDGEGYVNNTDFVKGAQIVFRYKRMTATKSYKVR
jgi:hypothetical protein